MSTTNPQFSFFSKIRLSLRHDPALAYILAPYFFAYREWVRIKYWWEWRHYRAAMKATNAMLAQAKRSGKWELWEPTQAVKGWYVEDAP